MKKWQRLVMAIMLFSGVSTVASAQKESKKNITIVVFGDSTTAPRGSLNIYAKALKKEGYNVINAGIGGNTTEMAAKRFNKDVVAHNPKLVVIQFGINDSAVDVWKKPPATKPRVALEKYGENIKGFIESLKKKKVKIILMTPNPCRWTAALKKHYGKAPYKIDDVDGWNVMLTKNAQLVRDIADAEKIPLVDVYNEFQNYDKKESQNMNDLLLDGMHPNNKGHAIVAELLIKKINEIMP